MIITKKHLRKKIQSPADRANGCYTVPVALLPERQEYVQGVQLKCKPAFLGINYTADGDFISYSEYELDGWTVWVK